MEHALVSDILTRFAKLPLDEKEFTAEIIKKQTIDARRRAIAGRAKNAMRNYRAGKSKRGTAHDLLKDLVHG